MKRFMHVHSLTEYWQEMMINPAEVIISAAYRVTDFLQICFYESWADYLLGKLPLRSGIASPSPRSSRCELVWPVPSCTLVAHGSCVHCEDTGKGCVLFW